MAQKEHADAVARAWQLHREGRNNDAIKAFEALLKTAPDHVDGHYGLGLAQRGANMKEAALESFNRTLRLLAKALENEPGVDRYEMLERMVSQRINELTGQPSK